MSIYDAVHVKEGTKKIKILVSKNCPHCETLKRNLKNKIDSGKIELVDSDSEYGNILAKKLAIQNVPTFIGVIEHSNGTKTVCKLGSQMQIEKCSSE